MSWLSRFLSRPPPEPPASTAPFSPDAKSKVRPGPLRLTSLNLDMFLREHPWAVVDVWAPWCGPCRALAPAFLAASHRWGDRVGFGKLHTDHEPSLVQRFGDRSIPSLLFFQEGRLVRTEVGALTSDELLRHLKRTFRILR